MPNSQVKSDTIDGVVLRLLGITPGTELDYEIYFRKLRARLAMVGIAGKSLPAEEYELLRTELKRAQKLKTSGKRFKVKEGRARVSTAPKETPKKKIEAQKLIPSKGAIVKAAPNKLAQKDINKVEPVKVRDITPKNPIDALREPLDSIFAILQSKFKFDQKQKETKRRKEEESKRGKRESSLEGFKKGISEIVAATKKMLAPFEDVINRIKRFIFFTLLGRAFTGFMEWMKDKGNQEKFNSFIEFLSKHWPALAGLYILFGTSLGKVVRGVVKLAARMVVALAMMIPKLFSFIRKNKKLSAVGFALGSYASGRVAEMLNSKEAPEAASLAKPTDDLAKVKPDIDKVREAPTPKLNAFNLGGLVPKFAAGGINPFGGMNLGEGIPIRGAGKDDTLIAAKRNEAILTVEDQEDLGGRYVDKETGQPLDIPQYLSGRKPGQVAFSKLRFPTLGGGFFGGGMIPGFNQGGIVGGRRLGKTSGRAWSPLESIIGNAKQKLLNQQAERNTTYFNPFADIFTKPKWHERLSEVSPEMRRYSMPGYNQNKWMELDQFRSTPPGIRGGWEKTEGKLRYTPWYQRPGFNRPLALQKGGLVENVGNWFRSIFNPSSKPSPAKSSKPKLLEEYQTPEAQALLKTIRAAEHYKGSNPYHAIYGGGKIPNLTQMTVKEVIDMGNTGKLPVRFGGKPAGYGSGSTATGAYQFMPFTLQDLVRRGVVKLDQLMTPQLQDKLGWELAKNRGVNLRSLKQTGLNQSIMDLMAPEWASFPHSPSGGKSFYGQPVKGADFLRQIYLDSLQRNKTTKKQSGGLVKENTGIKNPHSAPDRILAALQPGEFVVTREAAKKPGVLHLLENLNRTFDSNSAAYLGKNSVRIPQIAPPMSRATAPNIMELPPIMTSANGSLRPRASGLGGGSQVPSFSAVAPDNERDKNASIYGLVG